MKRIVIKEATIINEGHSFIGSVVIEDETITHVIEGTEVPQDNYTEVIDGKGKYLMPGVIDDHVHFREPGLTHKADLTSESKAAAAGGVTSFMDMPNTIPQTTTLETLNEKFDLGAEKSLINYSFYFGATNNNTHLLGQLDEHRICGVKLFMGSSTGDMLVDRKESLLRVFGGTNLLIAAHCEDAEIIARKAHVIMEKAGDDPDISYHPQIRSTSVCYESSALAVELADQAGARLHILHISTAKELGLFSHAPIEEKKITAEACVAHLMFYEKMYETLGTRIKCNPAIKTNMDRAALREAIVDNRIDVIATDHAPHLLSDKVGGAIKAASGMPMVQFSLVSMFNLVKKGVLTKEQLVQKMCHAPAQLFQIRNRGFIREGYQADLVLVNPEHEWTLSSQDVLSKCGWSPMEGTTFSSKVERTFVNGHTVYINGETIDSQRGQALSFR